MENNFISRFVHVRIKIEQVLILFGGQHGGHIIDRSPFICLCKLLDKINPLIQRFRVPFLIARIFKIFRLNLLMFVVVLVVSVFNVVQVIYFLCDNQRVRKIFPKQHIIIV